MVRDWKNYRPGRRDSCPCNARRRRSPTSVHDTPGPIRFSFRCQRSMKMIHSVHVRQRHTNKRTNNNTILRRCCFGICRRDIEPVCRRIATRVRSFVRVGIIAIESHSTECELINPTAPRQYRSRHATSDTPVSSFEQSQQYTYTRKRCFVVRC